MNFNAFYDNYIKNIKRQGLTFNYNFIKKKFDRGRLGFIHRNSFYKLSEVHFSKLIDMLSICNEMFPNRWDLEFSLDIYNGKKFLFVKNLIIHFPKVEIENSKGYSHQIQNLFMKLDLRFSTDEKENLYIRYIKGFRTTYTHKEVLSNYCHSHLPIKTKGLFAINNNPYEILKAEDFCLGSGEINYVLSDIETKDYDQNRFVNLFLNLISLSKWESLEGTPYRYIQEIKAKKTGGRDRFYIDYNNVNKSVVAICDYWKDNINSLKMLINIDTIDDGSIKVIDIGNFLDVPDELLNNYKKYLFVSEEGGNFYTIDSEGSFKKICDLSKVSPYVFRGKNFPIEVIEMLEDGYKEENIFVPAMVKREICKLLTNKIENELFKRSVQTREGVTYHK